MDGEQAGQPLAEVPDFKGIEGMRNASSDACKARNAKKMKP